MKLFKCKKCGQVYNSAWTTVSIFVPVRIGANGKLFVDTPDRNINGEEVRQLVPEKFTCITCDQPMAELTEFEECPHWWRTWHDCSQRQCEYCHAVQKGEVVWEE
jgi:hypothetical protein